MFLVSCSLYSSAGRKQFEEKAPASVVQNYSLSGCRDLSSAEAWFKSEFPTANNELIDLNQDYEVWAKELKSGAIEVTVLTKRDSNNHEAAQSCTYEFSSHEAWSTHRNNFLDELSNSLVSID